MSDGQIRPMETANGNGRMEMAEWKWPNDKGPLILAR